MCSFSQPTQQTGNDVLPLDRGRPQSTLSFLCCLLLWCYSIRHTKISKSLQKCMTVYWLFCQPVTFY